MSGTSAERRVGLLLDGMPGDGSFVDAAVSAADRVRAGGVQVDVRVAIPREPDPAWTAVLCHGSSHHDWVLEHQGRLPIVFTDYPEDHTRFDRVTLVDWAWYEGAFCLGWLAAATTSQDAPIAVMSGPAVLTQRRFADSFVEGVRQLRPDRVVERVHLESFRDHEGARRAWSRIRLLGGNGFLATSAGPAGEEVARASRHEGWTTTGFGRVDVGHAARVSSNITSAVETAIEQLADGRPLDRVLRFGLESGLLAVEPASTDSGQVAAALRDAAAAVALQDWSARQD